jgi:hypothetical protein
MKNQFSLEANKAFSQFLEEENNGTVMAEKSAIDILNIEEQLFDHAENEYSSIYRTDSVLKLRASLRPRNSVQKNRSLKRSDIGIGSLR